MNRWEERSVYHGERWSRRLGKANSESWISAWRMAVAMAGRYYAKRIHRCFDGLLCEQVSHGLREGKLAAFAR